MFAGQWSERSKSAATPFQGNRLYELWEIREVPEVEGKLRQADPKERNLMILWIQAFQSEIGESGNDTELRVDRGLAAGHLWLWDRSGETVSMTVSREPVCGVVRLSGVYTPPEKRKHGYAEACVRALSKQLRDAGHRCILYTDLGNPTSNSIYRRIGYRAVAELAIVLSNVQLERVEAKFAIHGSSATLPEPMLQALGSIPIRSFTADAIRWVQPR
jgi:predicted GNAT family acetyltransferase